MYLVESFSEHDPQRLWALIEQHPLAHIIVLNQQRLEAFTVPVLLEQAAGQPALLKAHLARANPLAQLAAQQPEVLLLFHLAQFYVSPNWYPTKAEQHRAVPTWNYGEIQLRGWLKAIEDEKYLRGVLAKLTRRHEQAQPRPWKISDAPADYIADQLSKIMAIEIEVSELVGKFKYSQNRSTSDRQGVVEGLTAAGQGQLAQWIKD
jgi:transcriptional regulator